MSLMRMDTHTIDLRIPDKEPVITYYPLLTFLIFYIVIVGIVRILLHLRRRYEDKELIGGRDFNNLCIKYMATD